MQLQSERLKYRWISFTEQLQIDPVSMQNPVQGSSGLHNDSMGENNWKFQNDILSLQPLSF